MMAHLAAAAANCTTGNWLQQWQCKWNAGSHQPTSAAVARAGFDFGHNALPVLIVLAFIFLLAGSARRRKATAPARGRAKVAARR
jgi:hypothetical protein